MPSFSTAFGRQRNRHNPGKYNCSLILRAAVNEHATAGDEQFSWDGGAAIAVNGLWRQTTNREIHLDGGRFSTASGVWEIPWVPNLTKAYRVEFGDRRYRIIGILNIEEQNRELELYVVEDEGAKGVGD